MFAQQYYLGACRFTLGRRRCTFYVVCSGGCDFSLWTLAIHIFTPAVRAEPGVRERYGAEICSEAERQEGKDKGAEAEGEQLQSLARYGCLPD